jgi:hypothetical protein
MVTKKNKNKPKEVFIEKSIHDVNSMREMIELQLAREKLFKKKLLE